MDLTQIFSSVNAYGATGVAVGLGACAYVTRHLVSSSMGHLGRMANFAFFGKYPSHPTGNWRNYTKADVAKATAGTGGFLGVIFAGAGAIGYGIGRSIEFAIHAIQ